jgi:hypothetical protein
VREAGEELRGFGEALAELVGVRGVDEQRHGLIAGDRFGFDLLGDVEGLALLGSEDGGAEIGLRKAFDEDRGGGGEQKGGEEPGEGFLQGEAETWSGAFSR